MAAHPPVVDLILCGGGPAACIIASRLAVAAPDLEILIIEAGPDSFKDTSVITPALYPTHQLPGAPRLKRFKSLPVEGGDELMVAVGRGMGGGSSVNFMFYNRAAASDFDDWKTKGWSSEELKPLLKKMETYHRLPNPKAETHGDSGPIHISEGSWPDSSASRHACEAATSLGYPITEDINDLQANNAYMERWPKYIHPVTGQRQDAAHTYLYPIREQSKNLHILCDHEVSRVIIENGAAVGVEYVPSTPDGTPVPAQVRARDLVVVSSGAMGSPPILERSGVGDPAVLQKAGVDSQISLPGVGAIYQDHYGVFAQYRVSPDIETHDEYFRGNAEVLAKADQDFQHGKGMHATNFLGFGGKITPTAEEAEELGPEFKKYWDEKFKNNPDKPAVCDVHGHTYLGGDPALLGPNPHGDRYIGVIDYLMYPLSRGFVHIRSGSPYDDLDFKAGYLTHTEDVKLLAWSYKKSREIVRRMKCFRGEEPYFHPQWPANSKARIGDNQDELAEIEYSAEDDAAIEAFLRKLVQGTWHSLGTCPMKPKEDGGVVDGRLNVHGVQRLKVADLSICPSNVGANTYNTALLVGEKAACLVAEDLGIPL